MTTQPKRDRQRRALVHVRNRITKWTEEMQNPEDDGLAAVKLALATQEAANLIRKGVTA